MGMGKTLNREVTEWGILTMVIVVISVVLLKFKTVDNVACDSLSVHPTYNAASNLCYNSTGHTTAINTLGSTVDTIVAGLSEPKNWLIIVIVALIGFSLIALFSRKKDA